MWLVWDKVFGQHEGALHVLGGPSNKAVHLLGMIGSGGRGNGEPLTPACRVGECGQVVCNAMQTALNVAVKKQKAETPESYNRVLLLPN